MCEVFEQALHWLDYESLREIIGDRVGGVKLNRHFLAESLFFNDCALWFEWYGWVFNEGSN